MSILITGSGVISSLGIGSEEFRAGLSSGAPGIDRETSGETIDPEIPVEDFQVARYLESEKTYLDRASAFALAACHLARVEAGWEAEEESTSRSGVILGTGYGCLDTMRVYYERVLERGAKFASALLFSHSYANTPASLVAIEYPLCGYHATVCTGLSSGAVALGQARDVLLDSRAEVIFAGGVEVLSPPLRQGLSAYLSVADSAGAGNRSGIALGEGAGVFVLETEAHGAARGVFAQGRITGVGLARSRRLGSGDGLERALRRALQEADRKVEEVDVVFAAANGWPPIEDEERAALEAVFPVGVPVTALKTRWGETVGAGTALDLAAALSAFADQQIPATVSDEGKAPCFSAGPLDVVTEPRRGDLDVALLSSIDFGGSCVSLVVEK